REIRGPTPGRGSPRRSRCRLIRTRLGRAAQGNSQSSPCSPRAASRQLGTDMHLDRHQFEQAATAYGIGVLEAHGNTLSADHADALRGIAELAGKILAGELAGRFRVGLPCGMGKSTMVRAT